MLLIFWKSLDGAPPPPPPPSPGGGGGGGGGSSSPYRSPKAWRRGGTLTEADDRMMPDRTRRKPEEVRTPPKVVKATISIGQLVCTSKRSKSVKGDAVCAATMCLGVLATRTLGKITLSAGGEAAAAFEASAIVIGEQGAVAETIEKAQIARQNEVEEEILLLDLL